MRTVLGIAVFLFIWIGACAFVYHVVPDIHNAYQMMIGAIAALIGSELSERIETYE